jgi:hypothetical protein
MGRIGKHGERPMEDAFNRSQRSAMFLALCPVAHVSIARRRLIAAAANMGFVQPLVTTIIPANRLP